MAKAQKQTRINGEVTRTKILEAAEALFGRRGFDAVSLREITECAGVTLALASYHFGTKDQLFEEVVARRASLLCEDRLARLAALETRSVESIIDAFVAPLFERAAGGEPGWSDYFRVLGRMSENDVWLDILSRHFDATATTYIDALCAAMPNNSRSQVIRGFTMMLNLMLTTVSQHRRIDRLTDGALSAADLKSAYRPFLRFVVAGMKAVAD